MRLLPPPPLADEETEAPRPQHLSPMELPQEGDSLKRSFKGLTGQHGGEGGKTRQRLHDSPRPGVSETDLPDVSKEDK